MTLAFSIDFGITVGLIFEEICTKIPTAHGAVQRDQIAMARFGRGKKLF